MRRRRARRRHSAVRCRTGPSDWFMQRPRRLRSGCYRPCPDAFGCAKCLPGCSPQRFDVLCAARKLLELPQQLRLFCDASGDLSLLRLGQAGGYLRCRLYAGQQCRDRPLVERLILAAHRPIQVGQPPVGDPQLGSSPRLWVGGQPCRDPFRRDPQPVGQVAGPAGCYHPGHQENANQGERQAGSPRGIRNDPGRSHPFGSRADRAGQLPPGVAAPLLATAPRHSPCTGSASPVRWPSPTAGAVGGVLGMPRQTGVCGLPCRDPSRQRFSMPASSLLVHHRPT